MGAGFELGFHGPGSRPVNQTSPKITPPDLRERRDIKKYVARRDASAFSMSILEGDTVMHLA